MQIRAFNIHTTLIGFYIFALTAVPVSVCAQEGDATQNGPETDRASTGGSEPSIAVRDERPYLFYTPSQIRKFRERIEQNSAYEKVWSERLKKASRIVENDQHNPDHLALLSLSYQVTGDD